MTRNVRSPGLAGARNSGIALAETELVAFCDDDDRWLPGKLSRQVEVFRSDPQARFVGCGIQVRYGERVVERTLPMDRVTFADLLRDRLTELHPSTFLIQRSLLDEIGLVDEALPGSYAEDYELLLRAARVAPVRSLPTVLVEVLWHPKSYFTGRWATVSAALQRLLATLPGLLPGAGRRGPADRPDRLRRGGPGAPAPRRCGGRRGRPGCGRPSRGPCWRSRWRPRPSPASGWCGSSTPAAAASEPDGRAEAPGISPGPPSVCAVASRRSPDATRSCSPRRGDGSPRRRSSRST